MVKKSENKPVVKTKAVERVFSGLVLSTAMAKTIVVRVDRMKNNSKYQKATRVSRKYHVHDEKDLAKVGNTVRFVECRPLSRTKRWRLKEIVK